VGREPLEYWIVHKPRGVLSTASDTHARATVLDLVPDRAGRLYPVGRLDRDTEGLVLLTNDGALTHRMLHPSFGAEREYRVTVRGQISTRSLERLAEGIELEDGPTAPATVSGGEFDRGTRTSAFSLTMIEGRKRQIRRALQTLGHPVVRLIRVRMGPLRLGDLAAGDSRPASARERRALARQHLRAGRDEGSAARN
jgi:23S rRNA pseudouridine2605 synthase